MFVGDLKKLVATLPDNMPVVLEARGHVHEHAEAAPGLGMLDPAIGDISEYFGDDLPADEELKCIDVLIIAQERPGWEQKFLRRLAKST